MYSLLIVDDEKFAAEGIRNGLDWLSLGINNVYVAHHSREAKMIYQSMKIDIMICDIEMPDETGLDLLAWVKEHSPNTESVFLTCHSEFAFAKKAVHLGSFDYLLKPADPDELAGVVRTMLQAVAERAEQQTYNEMYNKYKSLWDKQQPLLAEKFWLDFMSRRILTFGDFLSRALEDAQMQLTQEHRILPVLISIEEWLRVLCDRDKEIMEYAVKKAAEEMFLHDMRGHVIAEKNGLFVVMIYAKEADSTPHFPMDALQERAKSFIKAAEEYFSCHISSYIGYDVSFEDLYEVCEMLRQMERSNVKDTKTVMVLQNNEVSPTVQMDQQGLVCKISSWSEYLLAGRRDILIDLIRQTIRQLEASRNVDANIIETYYHDILQVIYHFLHVKGFTPNQVPNFALWASAHIRSLAQLQNWTIQLTTTVMNAVFEPVEDDRVINKAIQYMREHVEEDISREDVAAFVNLNSAYLSRLFRKQTGKSLIDYMIEFKMGRAKELLKHSEMTVSAVAQSLGYVNFSYFSKVFKKIYGMNPQDFRKT
ncbi:response regulator transcription factor [Paenibacillus hexagrammi]|uniref:Response regulator n=1 Tax=Paenibacillus hexagrammi TaxID=2908839 RepID=A0ABY3SCW8_9BACL|nr:response regulator [Paenibacillus sp. YPD9-1]UJF31833.1 response regulator [Paenibacillus sp. YPD9-1]